MDMDIKMINIVLCDQHAQLPHRGSPFSAGYDLYSIENLQVNPNERIIVNTGIKMAIPQGYYGRIAPRSGLAVKYGINTLAGVIDSDYRGMIKCVLHNTGNEIFNINIGDRIAQLIFEKCYDFSFNVTDNLENSERQEGGFGSTGKN